MNTQQTRPHDETRSRDRPSLTGSHHRTLEAIFRHPSAHNLEWSDVLGLIGKIGEVDEKANNEFAFHVDGELHLTRKPHTKDLTGSDVVELRKFLTKVGWSGEDAPQVTVDVASVAPSLLVVVDHHEARIYQIDLTSDDTSMHEIKPYDPHHFLHHLTHKGQSRERGQRAPEDEHFYQQIAQALTAGSGSIVVVGHGTGKSNAAHHLTDYLRSHDQATYQRVDREVVADFSSMTTPQLLDLARHASS
jgi:hypothetical protein